MSDADRMCRRESVANLRREIDGLAESSALLRRFLDHLRDQIIIADLEDGKNVGMVQRGQGASFRLKAGAVA